MANTNKIYEISFVEFAIAVRQYFSKQLITSELLVALRSGSTQISFGTNLLFCCIRCSHQNHHGIVALDHELFIHSFIHPSI
jgi:hypothetical protein